MFHSLNLPLMQLPETPKHPVLTFVFHYDGTKNTESILLTVYFHSDKVRGATAVTKFTVSEKAKSREFAAVLMFPWRKRARW